MKEYKQTMTIQEQERAAKRFITALREIAAKEENIDNFESYLSYHFEKWLSKYASTPEGIAAEFETFAKMEI